MKKASLPFGKGLLVNKAIKGKLVTTGEMADILGVSRRTISNYVNSGAPTAGTNPDDARAHMFNTADVLKWLSDKELEAAKSLYQTFDDEGQTSYNEARRRREVASMLEAELSLAKSLSEVANIDDIMTNVGEALTEIRAKIMSRSARLSGLLAHRDEHEVFDLIEGDSKDMLESLSDYTHEYKENNT